MSEQDLIEPRAWYSPTHGYFVMVPGHGFYREPRILRVADRQVIHEPLPQDSRELGASPTQWAYDQACKALKEHRERADNYEGRIKAVVEQMRDFLGGDWTYPPGPADLEFLVRTLIHQAYQERSLREHAEQEKPISK